MVRKGDADETGEQEGDEYEQRPGVEEHERESELSGSLAPDRGYAPSKGEEEPREAEMTEEEKKKMSRIRAAAINSRPEAFTRLHEGARLNRDDPVGVAAVGVFLEEINFRAVCIEYDGERYTNDVWEKVFDDDAWRDSQSTETIHDYRERLEDTLDEAR